MRKSKLQPLESVLQSLLQNGKSPIANGFNKWRLWSRWPEIVGKSLADFSDPVQFNQGTLTVWVKSSTHMHEMIYLRDELIRKINLSMGNHLVNKIFFTLDRKSVPTREAAPEEFKSFIQSTEQNDKDR